MSNLDSLNESYLYYWFSSNDYCRILRTRFSEGRSRKEEDDLEDEIGDDPSIHYINLLLLCRLLYNQSVSLLYNQSVSLLLL